MLDVFYKRRLKHDLEIWVERGWVGSAGAARILEEISTGDGRSRLPMVLGGIGVVCIALALAAFIAANWDGIPKYVKLAGIVAMILAAHGLAAWASNAGRKGVADLATAFATLVFVGGMALVGQIFHLPSDWAGGAFLVCLGGLAAAWITGSKASLIVAAVAAITWQVGRSDIGDVSMLGDLIGLVLLVAVFLHPVFHPNRLARWAALSLLLVTFGRWLMDTVDIFGNGDDTNFAIMILAAAGLSACLIQLGQVADLAVKWAGDVPRKSHGRWLMLMSMQDVGFAILSAILALVMVMQSDLDNIKLAGAMMSPPVAVTMLLALTLCGLGLLLSFKTGKARSFFGAVLLALVAVILPVAMQNVILVSALVMAALIGLSLIGTLYNNAFWTLCAYAGLTAVVLWLLQVTIGSLLGQSVFFLIAGVILLGMAFVVTRVLRRQNRHESRAGEGEVAS